MCIIYGVRKCDLVDDVTSWPPIHEYAIPVNSNKQYRTAVHELRAESVTARYC